MSQEKKYRKSRLRDLSQFVFANLSLSVSPCVQSASKSPTLASKLLPFYISRSGPINGLENHSFLMLTSGKKKTSQRRGEGGNATAYPRLLESASLVRCGVGPPHCCVALRRNMESLTAAYSRLLLHFFVSSLPRVFSSIN